MTDQPPEFEISSDKGDPSDIRNFTGVFQNPTSILNSSMVPLGSGGIFSGAFEEVSYYSMLTVTIFSDQNAATDGVKFQWSSDGINIDREEPTNLFAGAGRAFSLTVRSKFFRVQVTNGSSPQSIF